MHALGGGCQLPVAALAVRTGDQLHLRGRVLFVDGSDEIAGAVQGPLAEPETLGSRLAEAFLARGAGKLVERIEKMLQQEKADG